MESKRLLLMLVLLKVCPRERGWWQRMGPRSVRPLINNRDIRAWNILLACNTTYFESSRSCPAHMLRIDVPCACSSGYSSTRLSRYVRVSHATPSRYMFMDLMQAIARGTHSGSGMRYLRHQWSNSPIFRLSSDEYLHYMIPKAVRTSRRSRRTTTCMMSGCFSSTPCPVALLSTSEVVVESIKLVCSWRSTRSD